MGLCVGKETGGRFERTVSAARVANGSGHNDSYHESPPPKAKGPDFGLGEVFDAVEELGEGGSGETWLMVDKEVGRKVAVKLIRRPIPKVLHEMLLHEIQVGLWSVYASRFSCSLGKGGW